MTVTLPKGGNLLLAEQSPGIAQVRVGLGWTTDPGSGAVELDGLISVIDASSSTGRLLLTQQVPNPQEPVGTPPPSGPVVGDVDKLVVTLAAVPADVSRLLFGVTIYDAVNRRQTFRSVRGAYIRVVDDANGIEIARYTLEQETGAETAMVFGELYRNPRGWKFRAVGQGYASGLRGVAGVESGEPPIVRPLEVNGYLRRTSLGRSRRSFTEHLNPPKPAAPPARPERTPAQQRSSTPPAPAPPPKLLPTTPAAPPTRPAPAPARPAPAPARPAPAPAPTPPPKQPVRSSLDLSDGDESAAASGSGSAAGSTTSTGASRSGSHLVFGEHSSRYRQRLEHVSALTDDHPVTAWTEEDRGSGAMTVTLRWEPLQTASGLPRPSDLQLGCFWQAGDGAVGVMQSLGNAISAPGALGPRQVLRLGRRDEREGQTIFVDLASLSTFRRFFVFAFGLHGGPEWAQLRPVLTVDAPSGEQLSIRLGEAPQSARLCVIASFHIVVPDLIIRRENDYLDQTQATAAERYGWTFDWNSDGMTPREAL